MAEKTIIQIRKEDRVIRFLYNTIYKSKWMVIFLFLSIFPLFFKIVIPLLVINHIKDYAILIGIANLLGVMCSRSILNNLDFNNTGELIPNETDNAEYAIYVHATSTFIVIIFLLYSLFFSNSSLTTYENKKIADNDENIFYRK